MAFYADFTTVTELTPALAHRCHRVAHSIRFQYAVRRR